MTRPVFGRRAVLAWRIHLWIGFERLELFYRILQRHQTETLAFFGFLTSLRPLSFPLAIYPPYDSNAIMRSPGVKSKQKGTLSFSILGFVQLFARYHISSLERLYFCKFTVKNNCEM